MAHKGRFRTKLKRKKKVYYAIRNKDGTFSNIESLSKASSADRRKRAKKKVRSGQRFRGDRA